LTLVPRIGPSKIEKLEAEGIFTIEDLAASKRSLSDMQKRMLESWKTGRCIVEEGLPEVLESIDYPRYYLDFETVSPILPRYAGTSPIQTLPFQFSIHIERGERGELEHIGYLHKEDTDPRRPLAEVLLEILERYPSAPVLSYTNYEKRILNELAAALPDLENRIQSVVLRLVDLCDIVRSHVYHPDFRGSFSIKSVFPALVPDRNYDDLEIRDGTTASMSYLRMLGLLEADPKEAQQIYGQLWSYCCRDTEAMVEVMKALGALTQSAINPNP
jgi:predicted RecB family nuclease